MRRFYRGGPIILFATLFTPALALISGTANAAGTYFEVGYPAAAEPSELQLGVSYTLWIPDKAPKIRAIIVHQHGCGVGACKGGATAAYDLHWQALAEKWDAALLGPSFHQEEKQNCRLWCDPRNGSHTTFLRAIAHFAAVSKHPELETVPWCLWGHSGGGFWASIMETMYPQRIVAVWLRSGTAFATWEKGDIAKPEIPSATYTIPTMCNPGVKEKGDKRFNGAWVGCWSMFQTYREKGAPIGFAPDPRTAHECGDSRYLAIPFFDACLAMRLPQKGAADQKLRPIDPQAVWLGAPLTSIAMPVAQYTGEVTEAVWLPSEHVAKAWAEYVQTGTVGDNSPPPAPFAVRATAKRDKTVEITWQAKADFESGIAAFVVQRDNAELARVPEKPAARFGRPLFQAMSYHDTPESPLPEMRFVDKLAPPGVGHQYRIVAINSVGLRSAPVAAAAQ
jgi:pimeloyl-ACP methyl ester carboxylesterase